MKRKIIIALLILLALFLIMCMIIRKLYKGYIFYPSNESQKIKIGS